MRDILPSIPLFSKLLIPLILIGMFISAGLDVYRGDWGNACGTLVTGIGVCGMILLYKGLDPSDLKGCSIVSFATTIAGILVLISVNTHDLPNVAENIKPTTYAFKYITEYDQSSCSDNWKKHHSLQIGEAIKKSLTLCGTAHLTPLSEAALKAGQAIYLNLPIATFVTLSSLPERLKAEFVSEPITIGPIDEEKFLINCAQAYSLLYATCPSIVINANQRNHFKLLKNAEFDSEEFFKNIGQN